ILQFSPHRSQKSGKPDSGKVLHSSIIKRKRLCGQRLGRFLAVLLKMQDGGPFFCTGWQTHYLSKIYKF
ncbi:MAG: hypothetical protein IKD34_04145, partial [Oscillospiraceae bacterium]|nr:hypothetical protein [Oscillospiraceae bacterium]